MISKTMFVAIACFILSFSVTVLAQNSQPKMPLIQKDKCPFEGCKYGKWVARSPLTVYKSEGSSSVAFSIEPGISFTAVVGNVHVEKTGLAVVQKPTVGFKVGDKIPLLSYRGEGNYDLWYKRRKISSGDSIVMVNSKVIRSPEIVWWVKIKLKDGKQGWLKLKNTADNGFSIKEKIEGMDRFG